MRNALCIMNVRLLPAAPHTLRRRLRARAEFAGCVRRLCLSLDWISILDGSPFHGGARTKDIKGRQSMVRASLLAAGALVSMLASPVCAQTDFRPVTREMLANPNPGDWLMLNRTYDEQ